jgi:hypothetical protein
MFNAAALLLAVTLAISTTATPTPDSAAAAIDARGTTIPLRKRHAFTLTDGVFDKDKANAATVSTLNKHRQNLINLQNNLGALPAVSYDIFRFELPPHFVHFSGRGNQAHGDSSAGSRGTDGAAPG